MLAKIFVFPNLDASKRNLRTNISEYSGSSYMDLKGMSSSKFSRHFLYLSFKSNYAAFFKKISI